MPGDASRRRRRQQRSEKRAREQDTSGDGGSESGVGDAGPSSAGRPALLPRLLALAATDAPLLALGEPLGVSVGRVPRVGIAFASTPLLSLTLSYRVTWTAPDSHAGPLGSDRRAVFVQNLMSAVVHACHPHVAAVLPPSRPARAVAFVLQMSDTLQSQQLLTRSSSLGNTVGQNGAVCVDRLIRPAPPPDPLLPPLVSPPALDPVPLFLTFRPVFGLPHPSLVQLKLRGVPCHYQRRGLTAAFLEAVAGYPADSFLVVDEGLPCGAVVPGTLHHMPDATAVVSFVRPPLSDPLLAQAAGAMRLPGVTGWLRASVLPSAGQWVPSSTPPAPLVAFPPPPAPNPAAPIGPALGPPGQAPLSSDSDSSVSNSDPFDTDSAGPEEWDAGEGDLLQQFHDFQF